MRTEIMGEASDSMKMMLGQIRKIFDPDWIQVLGEDRFTVQFSDDTEAKDELVNFADMYGYELEEKKGRTWTSYFFE